MACKLNSRRLRTVTVFLQHEVPLKLRRQLSRYTCTYFTRVALLFLLLLWMFATTDSTFPWFLYWTLAGNPDAAPRTLTHNCPRSNSSLPLVVVIPFIAAQTPRLLSALDLWSTPHLFPCRAITATPRPVLAFYLDRAATHGATARAAAATRAHLQTPAVAHAVSTCFSAVLYGYANLSARESHNDAHGLPWLLTSLRVTGGTNAQFAQAFIQFSGHKYRHMVWLEPDVRPIRPLWLEALEADSAQSGSSFWMRGAVMHYVPRFHIGWEPFRSNYLRHLNGNALYALDNRCFDAFRTLVAEHFGRDAAFDVAMTLYLLGVGRVSVYQAVAHRFQTTDVIVGMGVTMVDDDAISDRLPDTFLVHGKYNLLQREGGWHLPR